ncbi:MAG: DUF805 domain-containing protein [Allosphingosinicella sp.]
MEWMLMPLKRYAEFSGRSRRKEYWMYVLLIVIATFVISFIEQALGLTGMVGPYGPLSALLIVGTFVPSLAVGIRRLHDTNRTGWWMLLGIVPYALSVVLLLAGSLALAATLGMVALLCAIALLVFMVLPGTSGPNQYGPDPKGVGEEVFA